MRVLEMNMKKPNIPKTQPPNSWMYAISAEFTDKDYVPPEAIRGAWRIGSTKSIEGEFQENENYIHGLKSTKNWPVYLNVIAKEHSNGWVYDIDKEYRNAETVPQSRIVGSWKVDETGMILPVFYPNKDYRG